MAVKKKKGAAANKTTDLAKLTEVIQKAIGELMPAASDNIKRVLDDSEDRKMTINFAVTLDESESEPLIGVGIRFSESYTDKRVTKLDDPDQIQLFRTLPKEPKAGEGEGANGGGEPEEAKK